MLTRATKHKFESKIHIIKCAVALASINSSGVPRGDADAQAFHITEGPLQRETLEERHRVPEG